MQTLIYTCAMLPLGSVPVRKGLLLCLLGKAALHEAHDGVVFRSVRSTLPAPRSVRLAHGVRVPGRLYGPLPLTRENLARRDSHRCQYCGLGRRELARAGHQLTRDHVLPRSRGGADTWRNVVLSCGPCNHRKADRTPAEAGMTLLREPRTPSRWEMFEMEN